jgi:triacylglycerol lipase
MLCYTTSAALISKRGLASRKKFGTDGNGSPELLVPAHSKATLIRLRGIIMKIGIRPRHLKVAWLFALLLGPALASAATNPLAKGPDPTMSSIQADGPFAISSQTVAGNGFGGATVYSPNTAGTYALVVFCPGFTATQSSIAVMGKRLATHGFVVATIDTNSTSDQPPSRATQMLAALRTVAALTTGPAAGKIDTSRQIVTGHSMGGGGTLIAATSTSTLKAAVPLAPWSQATKSFSGDKVPTAIIGGSADNVAPPARHATVFYNSIPTSTKKLLGIISGASHFFPQDNPANQPASYVQIAWIKRFVDNDTRYSQFLTGDSRFSTFNSDGPF